MSRLPSYKPYDTYYSGEQDCPCGSEEEPCWGQVEEIGHACYYDDSDDGDGSGSYCEDYYGCKGHSNWCDSLNKKPLYKKSTYPEDAEAKPHES